MGRSSKYGFAEAFYFFHLSLETKKRDHVASKSSECFLQSREEKTADARLLIYPELKRDPDIPHLPDLNEIVQ